MNKLINVLPVAFAMAWAFSACSSDGKSAGVTEESTGINMMASEVLLSWNGAARQYKADVGDEKANGSWFFDAYNAEGSVAGEPMPSKYALLDNDVLTSALDSCKGVCFSYELSAVDVPEDDEDFEYPYVGVGIALPKLEIPDTLTSLVTDLCVTVKMTSSAESPVVLAELSLGEDSHMFVAKGDHVDETCFEVDLAAHTLKPVYENGKITIFVKADERTMQGNSSITGTVNVEKLEWKTKLVKDGEE